MKVVLSTVGICLWKKVTKVLEEKNSFFEPLREIVFSIQQGKDCAEHPAVLKDFFFSSPQEQKNSLPWNLIQHSPEISSLMKIAEDMATAYGQELAKNACERAIFLALVRTHKETEKTIEQQRKSSANSNELANEVLKHYLALLPKGINEQDAKDVWKKSGTPKTFSETMNSSIDLPELTLHYALAASDTDDGEHAAKLINSLLRRATVVFETGGQKIRILFCPVNKTELEWNIEKNPTAISRIEGLTPLDINQFRTEGMQNLVKYIADTYKCCMISSGNGPHNPYNIGGPFSWMNKKVSMNLDFRINITAGYKGTIPYLTIVAQLLHIPLQYVYECSDALITIPPLPVGLDTPVIDEYAYYLFPGRLQQAGLDVQKAMKNLSLIDSTPDNTGYLLTAFGQLVQKIHQSTATENNLIGTICELKLACSLKDMKTLADFAFENNKDSKRWGEIRADTGEKFFGYLDNDGKTYFLNKKKAQVPHDKWTQGDIDVLVRWSEYDDTNGEEKKYRFAAECKTINAAIGTNSNNVEDNLPDQVVKNIVYLQSQKDQGELVSYGICLFAANKDDKRAETFKENVIFLINKKMTQNQLEFNIPIRIAVVSLMPNGKSKVNLDSFYKSKLEYKILEGTVGNVSSYGGTNGVHQLQ